MLAPTEEFLVRVTEEGEPLAGVRVVVVCKVAPRPPYAEFDGYTNEEGWADIPAAGTPVSVRVDSPDFWPTEIDNPFSGLTISTNRVRIDTGPLSWWHRHLRIAEYDINAGRGIKIGVIDTGLGEHESLTHAIYYEPIVSYEVLEFIEVGRSDLANHGTSVCGLIGARPPDGARDQHLAGVAPGVELHCVGVLKPDEVEARLPERLVGEAIRFLCDEKECDLLNLSFAADLGKPARILRNFVNDAFDAGCLSICAAGNCGALSGRRKSNVCAPAKYARSISVSALGKDGTGPECQPSPFKDPHDRTTWAQSGLYLATFSSRGREVFCSAPGVNLIAPNDVIARDIGPYSYVEGTSYSAPLVCGALAVELARREDFLALPRTARRSRKAREILRSICENIGVPTHLFGHGLPSVGNGNGPQPA